MKPLNLTIHILDTVMRYYDEKKEELEIFYCCNILTQTPCIPSNISSVYIPARVPSDNGYKESSCCCRPGMLLCTSVREGEDIFQLCHPLVRFSASYYEQLQKRKTKTVKQFILLCSLFWKKKSENLQYFKS